MSKKHVNFNMLLIGENGIGKKSFINTLCEQEVYKSKEEDMKDPGTLLGFETKEFTVKKDCPIRLSVHMTKNFGHDLNNTSTCDVIRELLDNKFEKKLQEEAKIERNRYIKDEIMHLVVLFVSPKNKGLKPLEIELIKMIENKCNLILVIGKSDLLTKKELELEKKLINDSIKRHNLKVYNFINESLLDEEYEDETPLQKSSPMSSIDEDFLNYFTTIQNLLPFSIINASTTPEKQYRTRQTMAGAVDIGKYSDFECLKEVLFNLNLQEFKDSTNNIIYELYRTERLTN